ncbi:DUF2207 domain-containing protein, partial [Bowmanella yangjiangensis]
TGQLPAYHGLTVAVDWQAGLVPRPTAMQRAAQLLRDNLGLALGAALLVGLALFYLIAWCRVGRDPRKGVIIPLFEAPQNMTAVQVGYLWHRGLRGDFSAAHAFGVWLTDMAIGKHLLIKDRPRSGFILSRSTEAHGELTALDADVLERLLPADKADASLQVGSKYEPRMADALGGLGEH